MPKKNFPNIGNLQEYEYVPGVMGDINTWDDTCSVVVGGTTYNNVPIYYHCLPEAATRLNGAVEGGAGGFSLGDEIVVLKRRTAEELFVIGHAGMLKACKADMIVIIASPSGDEAFAWDLLSDSLVAGKASLSDIQHAVGSGLAMTPSGFHEVKATLTADGYDPGYDMPLYSAIWEAQSPWAGMFNTKLITGGWQPYYSEFEYPFIQNPDDPEDKQGAYYVLQRQGLQAAATFDSHVGWAGATHEINTNTGHEWVDRDYIDRHQLYHRPLFGVPFDNIQGHPINCEDNKFHVHLMYDSWADVTITNKPSDHYVPMIDVSNDVLGNGAPINELFSWPSNAPLMDVGNSFFLAGSSLGYKGALAHYSMFWDNSGIASIGSDHAIMEQHIIHGDFISNETGDLISPPANSKRMIRLYLKRDNPLEGMEKEIWDLVNDIKTDNDQPAVVFNQALYEAAKRHAEDLAGVEAEYWTCPYGDKCHVPGISYPGAAHYGTDLSLAHNRAFDAGYNAHVRYWNASWEPVDTYDEAAYGEAGVGVSENVNAIHPNQTAQDCVDEWMASEGHRKNILNELEGMDPPFNEGGLAVAYSENYVYIVQVFGIRHRLWPGFAGRKTENMISYMDTNFNWAAAEDKKRLPVIYFL